MSMDTSTPRCDLVPGRSGQADTTLLQTRDDTFRSSVKVATLDPFHDNQNAIADRLHDDVTVLDALHIVKFGTPAVDEVRRRVQQDIHGHRGRWNDPVSRIRNILDAGIDRLTDLQHARLRAAFVADDSHVEGEVTWRCAPQLRSVYHQTGHASGARIAEQVLAHFPSPIPEIARLGPDPEPVARRVPEVLHHRQRQQRHQAIRECGDGWSGDWLVRRWWSCRSRCGSRRS